MSWWCADESGLQPRWVFCTVAVRNDFDTPTCLSESPTNNDMFTVVALIAYFPRPNLSLRSTQTRNLQVLSHIAGSKPKGGTRVGVDWKEFLEALERRINTWGIPNFITSQSMLDRECEKLTKALQETIDEKVPNVIPGPQAKLWWTKDLTNLRKDTLNSRRKICKNRHKINGLT